MKPTRLRLIPVLFIFAEAHAIASAPVKLPPYDREVLPNGIVMYLVPKHESPLVDLTATIRGGAESEGPGEAGTCAMVADLLRRGTKTRTAAQFSAELDQMGARFGADVDAQSTTISLEVLSSQIGHATKVFADAILHPVFPKAEVRLERGRALDYARSLKDSAGDAAWYYFYALLFGDRKSVGRPPSGDELTLPHVTRADITNYYRRMYVGSNLILVAAGEFDVAEMRARLVRAFSPMPAGRPYRWMKAIPAGAPPVPRVVLVDRPGATVTNFVIGVPGISRTSPDHTALWLANTILGGGFTSVLNEALRVTSGLTYGISSSFDENRMPGAIGISSSTRTGQTGQAIEKTMALWSGLCEGGFTA
ncbi:MAG: insulinase family protein, partial [Acidobacteria bacterium]|nr:insulinase family protein [Acidobacteriota bacterium]